ncbi:hypothetical protein [Microscilla marina]|uniref:Uncharacterized protein n=1 Tax=Microscilla marina ATCC 23134 TaxID=313606 RepID=A1ZU82_MICM2|nr:hypothetical protein [Microscilla marina]EAY26053.1 hypothetical protein M23134_06402 [Microscilla marina ATCC 23134]
MTEQEYQSQDFTKSVYEVFHEGENGVLNKGFRGLIEKYINSAEDLISLQQLVYEYSGGQAIYFYKLGIPMKKKVLEKIRKVTEALE